MKKQFLFLLLSFITFLIVISCDQDDDNPCNPNPCIDLDRGICTVVDKNAVCSCNDGFQDIGNKKCGEKVEGVEIADNVRLIDNELSAKATVNENSITFPLTGNGWLLELTDQHIIVSGYGNGFLRWIESVSKNDDMIIIETSPAALTDAIIKGSLSTTLNLSSNDLLEQFLRPDGTGVYKQQMCMYADPLIDYSFDGYVIAKGQISDVDYLIDIKRGYFRLKPDINVEMDINESELQHFKATIDSDIEAGLYVHASVSRKFEKSGESEPKILISKTFVQFIGYFPVVEVVTLEFNVGYNFEANATVGFVTGVEAKYSAKAELKYPKDESAANKDWDATFDYNAIAYDDGRNYKYQVPDFSETGITATLKAYLKPKISIDFYAMVGPRLSVMPALVGNGEVKATPPRICWDLDYEVTGKFEIELKIFTKKKVTNKEGKEEVKEEDESPPIYEKDFTLCDATDIYPNVLENNPDRPDIIDGQKCIDFTPKEDIEENETEMTTTKPFIEGKTVTLTALVTTKNGQPFHDLNLEHFNVTEEIQFTDYINTYSAQDLKVEQIQDLDGATSQIVLVLDASTSLTNRFETIKDAARAFISSLSEDDEIMIVHFGATWEVLHNFTNDKTSLYRVINEQVGRNIDTNTTALWGTLRYIMQDVFISSINPNDNPMISRAIVLLTDGADNGSKPENFQVEYEDQIFDRLIEIARDEIGIPVFSISYGYADTESLNTLARTTGARSYYAINDSDLIEFFELLGLQVKSSYRLSWTTSGISGDYVTAYIRVEYESAFCEPDTCKDRDMQHYIVP